MQRYEKVIFGKVKISSITELSKECPSRWISGACNVATCFNVEESQFELYVNFQNVQPWFFFVKQWGKKYQSKCFDCSLTFYLTARLSYGNTYSPKTIHNEMKGQWFGLHILNVFNIGLDGKDFIDIRSLSIRKKLLPWY